MKNILHLQLPETQEDWPSVDILGKFMTLCRNALGDSFAVIVSPCSPAVLLDYNTEFKNFQMDNITKDELMNLLSKGEK